MVQWYNDVKVVDRSNWIIIFQQDFCILSVLGGYNLSIVILRINFTCKLANQRNLQKLLNWFFFSLFFKLRKT